MKKPNISLLSARRDWKASTLSVNASDESLERRVLEGEYLVRELRQQASVLVDKCDKRYKQQLSKHAMFISKGAMRIRARLKKLN